MAERKEMSNTGQLQISQILLEHILFLHSWRAATKNGRLQEKVPETFRNNMTQHESVGEPTLFVILVSKEGHQLSNVSNVCQQQIWNTRNTSKNIYIYKTNSKIPAYDMLLEAV